MNKAEANAGKRLHKSSSGALFESKLSGKLLTACNNVRSNATGTFKDIKALAEKEIARVDMRLATNQYL
jgi:hypothetical protein